MKAGGCRKHLGSYVLSMATGHQTSSESLLFSLLSCISALAPLGHASGRSRIILESHDSQHVAPKCTGGLFVGRKRAQGSTRITGRHPPALPITGGFLPRWEASTSSSGVPLSVPPPSFKAGEQLSVGLGPAVVSLSACLRAAREVSRSGIRLLLLSRKLPALEDRPSGHQHGLEEAGRRAARKGKGLSKLCVHSAEVQVLPWQDQRQP